MNLQKYITKGLRMVSTKFRKVANLLECCKGSTNTIAIMSIDDIDYLNTFKIQALSEHSSPKIYANGRNQVAIEIIVKASKKDGSIVSLTENEWLKGLNLCFAASNETLNRDGSSSWCFTNLKNEYCREVQGEFLDEKKFSNSVKDDGTAIIILYVYTDVVEESRIAVRFDTDQKHFTTSDISSNAEKMSVIINAITPINYGNKNNIEIICRDFVNVNEHLGWTSRLTTEGPYTGHSTGMCRRRIVEIHPVYSSTGQTNFKEYSLIYYGVRNEDVNKDHVEWAYHSGTYEDCFKIIQSDSCLPCAVIGRGYYSGQNYQTNLWFPLERNIHIDGQYFLCDASYYYRFCPYVVENHSNDDTQGIPSVLLYKFQMPVGYTYQYYWADAIHNPSVYVTDHYGNKGVIQLIFDDSEHFDVPGII